MILHLKVWKTLEQSYGKEELESKKEQAANRGRLNMKVNLNFTFLLIIFSTFPLQVDCTNGPPRWELFPKPLPCQLPALSGRLATTHNPVSDLPTSVTCSVSGTGDLAPLDWMTYRSVLIRQEKSYAFLTSEIGTFVQPIAPVKGATLVEEEFMEEEKVKSEIYVYYMKTVGESDNSNTREKN